MTQTVRTYSLIFVILFAGLSLVYTTGCSSQQQAEWVPPVRAESCPEFAVVNPSIVYARAAELSRVVQVNLTFPDKTVYGSQVRLAYSAIRLDGTPELNLDNVFLRKERGPIPILNAGASSFTIPIAAVVKYNANLPQGYIARIDSTVSRGAATCATKIDYVVVLPGDPPAGGIFSTPAEPVKMTDVEQPVAESCPEFILPEFSGNSLISLRFFRPGKACNSVGSRLALAYDARELDDTTLSSIQKTPGDVFDAAPGLVPQNGMQLRTKMPPMGKRWRVRITATCPTPCANQTPMSDSFEFWVIR